MVKNQTTGQKQCKNYPRKKQAIKKAGTSSNFDPSGCIYAKYLKSSHISSIFTENTDFFSFNTRSKVFLH